jgi:uncharacterized coiled-coil protein SlyX
MNEFERVAKQEEWCCTGRTVGKDEEMGFGCRTSLQAEYIRDAHNWTVSELTIAHEKDMTAKDKRIAELEAQVADYKEDLIEALQDVISYAPACTSSIEYAEKRLKELTEVE